MCTVAVVAYVAGENSEQSPSHSNIMPTLDAEGIDSKTWSLKVVHLMHTSCISRLQSSGTYHLIIFDPLSHDTDSSSQPVSATNDLPPFPYATRLGIRPRND